MAVLALSDKAELSTFDKSQWLGYVTSRGEGRMVSREERRSTYAHKAVY